MDRGNSRRPTASLPPSQPGRNRCGVPSPGRLHDCVRQAGCRSPSDAAAVIWRRDPSARHPRRGGQPDRPHLHGSLRDAARRGAVRRRDDQGLLTNTTILGEHVEEEAEAGAVADAYGVVLDRLAAERLRTNVALKLTHLGLDFGEEVAYANVEQVVRKAGSVGNFIRIDMEESKWVDATLRIYRRLREAGHDNVGTVLQAYLYRTENDLESLLNLKPNLRLVKGAYLEPAEIAYPLKQDVDAAYERLLGRMLTGCSYVGVATHDERLIQET